MGHIYYTMLFGEPPINPKDSQETKASFSATTAIDYKKNGIKIDKRTEEILDKMLTMDETKSITLQELFNICELNQQ